MLFFRTKQVPWTPRYGSALNGIDEFDALDYVEVNGDVTVFNGQTQLSIKRARKISETDVDPTNYLPCTNKNIDEMMIELTKFIAGVNNPYYKQVLTKLFIDNTEFAEAFKKHSSSQKRTSRFYWRLA